MKLSEANEWECEIKKNFETKSKRKHSIKIVSKSFTNQR